MRKRSYYKKRELKGDPVYNRTDINRFVSYLMKTGKRNVAEKNFYLALKKTEEQIKKNPVEIFEQAINNASPIYEVASRRLGGANYLIPREVRPERKFFLAAHWIINAARSRKSKPIAEKLAEEIIAAYKNEGTAIKKKHDTHKMAEANRAFASLFRR